jgi:hypothetical protein
LPPPDVLKVSEHFIKSDAIQTSVADIRKTAFVVSSMNIIIELRLSPIRTGAGVTGATNSLVNA